MTAVELVSKTRTLLASLKEQFGAADVQRFQHVTGQDVHELAVLCGETDVGRLPDVERLAQFLTQLRDRRS